MSPEDEGPSVGDVGAVAEALETASGVVVLTGAGVSAESGISTFRDPNGVWARYDPAELATPEAFARDPDRVWEWYAFRRRSVRECEPNPGHRALARLLYERADVTLVTQNVDGLHHRALRELPHSDPARLAGAEARILELHGNLVRVRCSGCGAAGPGDVPDEGRPPACGTCGALLRPDVVWFGEMLDPHVLEAAFDAASEADVCIVAGTSAVVHPAASVPLATLESGGALVEVNPEPTPLTSRARWSLRGPSGEVLPRLVGAATEEA